MSDNESLMINLNSQGPYVINNANLNAVQYQLPFATLPRKYSKFMVQSNFRSNTFNGLLLDVGWVNINFGRMNICDGGQVSNNIAMIYPIVTNTSTAITAAYPGGMPQSSYYACATNDNCDFMMDYPQSGSVTITLKTFAGVNIANMQHYNLQLLFTGMKGSEIGVANLLSFKNPTTF